MLQKNKSLLIFALIALLFIFWRISKQVDTQPPTPLSYKTYQVHNGWGYRIFASDTAMIIQQDVIPGIHGAEAFETEEKAAQTARLVLNKIVKGVFPPTVSIYELDSMKVISEEQKVKFKQ